MKNLLGNDKFWTKNKTRMFHILLYIKKTVLKSSPTIVISEYQFKTHVLFSCIFRWIDFINVLDIQEDYRIILIYIKTHITNKKMCMQLNQAE